MTQAELEGLVRAATIVVDTNVLLDLYRLSVSARDEALVVLESIRPRLWVPHQVVEEFRRNVDIARGELAAAYEKSRDLLVKSSGPAKEAFGASRRWKESRHEVHALIDDVLKDFSSRLAELIARDTAIVQADDDPILRRIEALLDAAAPDEPDPLVIRQRVEDFIVWRAPNRIPPGFRDVPAKHTPLLQAGDYLVWCEILDHAERTPTPFLLVTSDQKDDWFAKDGQPLADLLSEFARRSPHRYHQMTFDDFLTLARAVFGASVTETTLEEVVEERRASAADAIAEAALSRRLRRMLPDNIAEHVGSDMREESLVGEPTKRLLARAIEDLGERERLVLVLYYYEGMTLAEIARVLGITESRIRDMHTNAMLRLRARLAESDPV